MPSTDQWPPDWTPQQVNEAMVLSVQLKEEFMPIQILFSSLSCVCCFLILLSGYLLYKELVKGKIYVKMVMMISLCDFLAALVMTFGYPKNDSLCQVQAFSSVLFFRASWFWTIASTIMVFLQIQSRTGRLPSYMKFEYVFSYILVLSCILQAIPFMFDVPYGACYGGIAYGHIKWIGPHDVMVHMAAEFGWLSACIMISLILPIILRFYTLPKMFAGASAVIQKIVRRLVAHMTLYPLAMIIFWGPGAIYGAYIGIKHQKEFTPQELIDMNKIFLALGSWSYLFGVATSLIFISKSPEARASLIHLFSEAFGSKKKKDVTGRTGLQDKVDAPAVSVQMQSGISTPSTNSPILPSIKDDFDTPNLNEDDDFQLDEVYDRISSYSETRLSSLREARLSVPL